MNYQIDSLKEGLKHLKMDLTELQIQQLIAFYEKLVQVNQVMNLTTIIDWEDVVQKHFIDSLALVKVVDLAQVKNIIDVGTGAGFPGIPLKIAFPHLRITLIDSLNKRIQFLNEVIALNKLTDIEAVHGRAEDLARQVCYREQADICVSRAVSNLRSLSEYCLPFVKVGGQFIAYKAGAVEEEVKEANRAMEILGGKKKQIQKFDLPNSDIARTFVIVDKVSLCSKKYPRKAGMATSSPL